MGFPFILIIGVVVIVGLIIKFSRTNKDELLINIDLFKNQIKNMDAENEILMFGKMSKKNSILPSNSYKNFNQHIDIIVRNRLNELKKESEIGWKVR